MIFFPNETTFDPATDAEQLPDTIAFYDPGTGEHTFLYNLLYSKPRHCGISVFEAKYGDNTSIQFSPLVKKVITNGWDYAIPFDSSDPSDIEQEIGHDEVLFREYIYEGLTSNGDMYVLDQDHFRSNEVLGVSKGFETVTVIEPELDGNGVEHKTVHHHVGRTTTGDNDFNRLMFGKTIEVEKYSGTDLVERVINEYEYTHAFENGFSRFGPNSQEEYSEFSYADQIPSTIQGSYPGLVIPSTHFDDSGNSGFSFFEYPKYLRSETGYGTRCLFR